jgi:hypothetical protein
MSDMQPTYEFEDDLVTASVNGKVIASGSDLAEVEAQVAEVLAEPAPSKEARAKKATHITNPNGLKGEILSRTAATWGDAVTVRFENGQIQTMYITDEMNFTTEAPKKTASTTPMKRLASVVEENVSPDRESLKARQATLTNVRVEAQNLIAQGGSVDDMYALNEIVLQAENEQREIKQALEYMDATEGEGYQPYKPDMQVIDGENVGHQNGGQWLEHTFRELEEQAKQTDFDALLEDGPTLLVSEQDDDVVADAGAVRELALSHVQSRTAGLIGDQIDEYERLFVARAEEARRVELAHRKQTVKKEAAQKKSNVDDAPVESLFL